MSWIEFWNQDTSIYVSARHKALHYRQVARDIAALIDSPDAVVLDYGSGEATSADIVAARCAALDLCDAAPNTRLKMAEQFAGIANIRVLSTEDVQFGEDAHYDLIVANSLLQYLDEPTLDGLLDLWARRLKPGGRLILADVIPPGVSPVTDALALLRFAFSGGFFMAAVLGLARTFFSDYRKLRGELGISMHAESALLTRLRNRGFSARRMPDNIGHNPARMTFEAIRPGEQGR
ncbi:MAG TPA: class I SAM-dependent methyltransferase [Beijerinckiaceae bacterium]|nr:class I SAM-dependent methyltransferase [Beijerinckiaceae bacterium]